MQTPEADRTEADRTGSPQSRAMWRRRARTIPTMLGVTTVAVVSLPLTVPLVAGFDLARSRRRLPTVRAGAFALRYGVNDSAEILAAPALWFLARIGGSSPDARARSTERYRRVQAWSIRTLAEAADRFVGVRIDPAASLPVDDGDGPLIVLCRHVSMLDSSLPTLLFGLDSPWQVRSVVTDEALADPGFDLIYPALGTVFIDRDDGASARRIVRAMSDRNGPNDVVTIYPEGRVFRPAALARSLARLAETRPERAERLAGLRHVLPPRPGGTLALLDALPTADVIVIGHVGFERAASMAEMAARAPLDITVSVHARRVARADIPADVDDRIDWLDRLWLDLDDWVDST